MTSLRLRYRIGRADLDRRLDKLACRVAHRLPRRLRLWAVVDAAARAREPEMRPGGGYCGPDGLTYKDLHDAAAGS